MNKVSSNSTEVAHYVVTAHPPGSVFLTVKCNFTSKDATDVIVAKSRCLEIRQIQDNSLNVVLSVPIHGRINVMLPIRLAETSYLFIMTERWQYAVVSFGDNSTLKTCAHGSFTSHPSFGREAECAPLAAVDPHGRCIALHLFDGLLTVIPLNQAYNQKFSSLLGEPYHVRIEERTLLEIVFLFSPYEGWPQLSILHQDSRSHQHVATVQLDLKKRKLVQDTNQKLLKKSRVDGGSSMLIPVPGGGLLVVGQRQITYLSTGVSKLLPIAPGLVVCCDVLRETTASCQYLLGDEYGNISMIVLHIENGVVSRLDLEGVGTCSTLPTCLCHVSHDLLWIGSQFGDSQLVQLPAMDAVNEIELDLHMLPVLQEVTNLGPIVDFNLISNSNQQVVVTASGTSYCGSLRLVRNGIGMNEYACVDMDGIQNMWSLAGSKDDEFLVQSFVGETRVLGVVQQDDEGGTLEEVVLGGLDSSSSSLFVGNVVGSILQITESEIRLLNATTHELETRWSQEKITVASANKAGQIVVAAKGGVLYYLVVQENKILLKSQAKMDQEVSCINLDPFAKSPDAMDTDDSLVTASSIVAVGLWVDFTVRLLDLTSNLQELLEIPLSTNEEEDESNTMKRINRNNVMARSLCLVTLDSSGSTVDMLFVGLGDGTCVSFAILMEDGKVDVRSKKEVSLGTQRIDLVTLTRQDEESGTCVLATGDRPTVIYLAGGNINQSNPKLLYSHVNLATEEQGAEQSIVITTATPFWSSLLMDKSQQYSLVVADDTSLRLGVIDDIQKLHVTTCRLGMAPRRVVHTGRLFCVGCIESGVREGGRHDNESSMGNCIRFLDDTTFDDVERIDMDPFEMILSMTRADMWTSDSSCVAAASGVPGSPGQGQASTEGYVSKCYLLVGTAYVFPDEDEPTRGRILVYSCSTHGDNSTVQQVTELQVRGGVYSICQFYQGKVLASINSKTQICELVDDGAGAPRLQLVGIGHHGHILSLFVKSRADVATKALTSTKTEFDDVSSIPVIHESPTKQLPGDRPAEEREQIAIVGDLMRSISLVQYYPQHDTLEEIARDFNSNWTTAVEMLSDDVYLGAENWNNLFVLKRNAKAQNEEIRCRLDTVGEYHLGEMVNKFMAGSLVPQHGSTSSSARRGITHRPAASSPKKKSSEKMSAANTRTRRLAVTTGSQTLFGTVDGTLGCILGLDMTTAVFFATLERAMEKVIPPIGNLGHYEFRSFNADQRNHPSHGFIDGDLLESFLDLDRPTMERIVQEMNEDGGWEVADYHGASKADDDVDMAAESVLAVEDVLAMVEEISMLH